MKYFTVKKNRSGSALTVVIVFTIIVVMLGAYILSFAVNQKRVMDNASTKRIVPYYRSKAGVVNANWRLKTGDQGTGYFSSGTYANQYDYYLDIETDTVYATVDPANPVPPNSDVDVHIKISAPDPATGLRTIKSTGLDK